MQSRFTYTALALLIAAACAGAQAQSRTREDVRKELAEAMREGNLPHGEFGARQQLPGADAALSRRTRDDVRAELQAAQRSGDMLAAGESSQKLNELQPSLYPQQPMVAGKTRAQVLAELAQAQRNGEMPARGRIERGAAAPGAVLTGCVADVRERSGERGDRCTRPRDALNRTRGPASAAAHAATLAEFAATAWSSS